MYQVIDLFSGAGGMSYGFHQHPQFHIIGAVDAERAKPSAKPGSLACNATYAANIGLTPLVADLATLDPTHLRTIFCGDATPLSVLIACPPCTGFSRTLPGNHSVDDPRNSLVQRSAAFVAALRPTIFLMENVRELICGTFQHHYAALGDELTRLGYAVHGAVHLLNRFGLPQKRERALIIAVRPPFTLHTLDELWSGFSVRTEATHVRRAIGGLPPITAGAVHPGDPMHTAPRLGGTNLRRIAAIPHDGGSWAAVRSDPAAADLLTGAMQRAVAAGDLGSHPDVYGRLAWDRPAVTIKRECSHIGNGRYAHPVQDRLCTVRELAILQGFPRHYQFVAASLANRYRQLGDAVPPLISYQLAHLCEWILTGRKPAITQLILPDTLLRADDLVLTDTLLSPALWNQLDMAMLAADSPTAR
ncbi:MAG: DNA cytosine methyltransferase [Chloroflexota bacterium]|nr:DNA cytosine methyltransferase [Chloroflexota bacterium]